MSSFALGCMGSDDTAVSADGSQAASPRGAGVGQSGAQDFGRFRSIIEAGELPAPETLDMVGFFAEHKIELPDPTCGENVCLHGMMGVQGNMINGANCTIMLLGMNTALNAQDYDRPPLNMSVVVDTSGSMSGAPIEMVRKGLLAFADTLDPKDTVTLITYSSEATAVLESDPTDDANRTNLINAIQAMTASGGTNIYDGLRLGLEAVDTALGTDRQNRVILLSDGVATAGLTDNARIIHLGETYAARGIGITTIGVGDDFDINLMRSLANSGSGNFYFLEDLNAVEEVFVEEVNTFLIPLAEDVNIRFDAQPAYDFRAVYGTRTWNGANDHANIYIPALFMASRTAIDDIGPGTGRRGGGGMILLELTPGTDETLLAQTPAGAAAGTVALTYRVPGTDRYVEEEIEIDNALKPGETPMEGVFDDSIVEKGFVTLNIFAGFQMAIERASTGSPSAALNVLEPLIDNVEAWLETHDDIDIEEDLKLMNKLTIIIENRGASTERIGVPPSPWPQD